MSRLVLGINTDHGDSSAALIGESGPIAAIAEERIVRRKHTAVFPASAIREVLRIAGADLRDVTDIAVARDANANLSRKAAFLLRHRRGAWPLLKRRLQVHRAVASTLDRIVEELGCDASDVRADFHRVEHHLAHVASAYFWSGFSRASALTCDGAGDFATAMAAHCEGNRVHILRRQYWPHSLGVYYSAMTQFLGFDRYGEEYKVMGLSAYGKNRFGAAMRQLVRFDPYLGLRLDLRYFQHHTAGVAFEEIVDGEIRLPQLWGPRMRELFGEPRQRGEELSDRDRDIAASMQVRFEEVYLELVADTVARTGCRDIVMAGGSVLNSVANGRMLTEGYVDRAYFQPAASDDGTATGAAAYVMHAVHGVPATGRIEHAFWGTGWDEHELEAAVRAHSRKARHLDEPDLLATTAQAIADGKIVGWFQGREEWGPRALGNRSILCNPAYPDMKATLNARIKNREPFRPFAPVIREEDLGECFEGTHPVPFMIVVYKVRPEWREKIPAVVHNDDTGRVQTVSRVQNPLYYALLTEFRERTGVPVLLNTSFNENEPIVHTPEQAIDCFERTHMDGLALGRFWFEK